MGAAARRQRAYNEYQPVDPTRAAQAILRIARTESPPLRVMLGTDAINALEKSDLDGLDERQRWQSLSISTDYL